MEKQKMNINRKVLTKEKEFEVKADIIVPDIKPDVVAIKTVNANTYICKEEASKEKIRLEGNLDGYVVYLSENGDNRCLEVTLNYVENVEDELIEENFEIKHIVNLKNIEAKVLNERKICVTAKVEVKIECFEKAELEFVKSVDDENIQVKEEIYKIKEFVGKSKASTAVRENLEVDSQTSITEISKVEYEISNIENKISFNKVLSKADLNVKVTYQTEDLKELSISAEYPITSFIDMENIKENYICDSNYVVRNMFFKVDSIVSNKISFEIDFDVNLNVYVEEKRAVIQDMYSLNKDINFEAKEIELDVNGENRKINFIENVEEKECENKNEYSMVVYFVKPHDTVWKIAKMFKVTMESIIKANNLEDPNRINVGEKLYILK